MDFRFNINDLLPKRINKITHTLLPEGFKGDRRQYNECQRLLTRILDDMGEASAKAQGLNRTITNALKLRDTDHIVYLMVDSEGSNGLGSIVGLLKTGSKTLFMFDENGLNYQLKPRCILDFYIHETRQRMGLGNELYQYMLCEENLKPIKLAIDRPSDKFLAFLKKHYGLDSIIQQNNNFVVFKGFFDDELQNSQNNRCINSLSPSKQSTECQVQSNNTDIHSIRNNSINGIPITRSTYGRYAASRPPCSMANIIHNTSTMEPPTDHSRSLRSAAEVYQRNRPNNFNFFNEIEAKVSNQDEILSNNEDIIKGLKIESDDTCMQDLVPEETDALFSNELNAPAIPLSNNEEWVGSSTNANEMNLKEEISTENSLNPPSPTCSQEVSTGNQQPTAGHLDLKFYHSPLW